MAYRARRNYSGRASAGYGRGRASGFSGRASYGRGRPAPARRRSPSRAVSRRAAPARQQVVRLVIEQAPASGISRATERILGKMNPTPGKAKL